MSYLRLVVLLTVQLLFMGISSYRLVVKPNLHLIPNKRTSSLLELHKSGLYVHIRGSKKGSTDTYEYMDQPTVPTDKDNVDVNLKLTEQGVLVPPNKAFKDEIEDERNMEKEEEEEKERFNFDAVQNKGNSPDVKKDNENNNGGSNNGGNIVDVMKQDIKDKLKDGSLASEQPLVIANMNDRNQTKPNLSVAEIMKNLTLPSTKNTSNSSFFTPAPLSTVKNDSSVSNTKDEVVGQDLSSIMQSNKDMSAFLEKQVNMNAEKLQQAKQSNLKSDEINQIETSLKENLALLSKLKTEAIDQEFEVKEKEKGKTESSASSSAGSDKVSGNVQFNQAETASNTIDGKANAQVNTNKDNADIKQSTSSQTDSGSQLSATSNSQQGKSSSQGSSTSQQNKNKDDKEFSEKILLAIQTAKELEQMKANADVSSNSQANIRPESSNQMNSAEINNVAASLADKPEKIPPANPDNTASQLLSLADKVDKLANQVSASTTSTTTTTTTPAPTTTTSTTTTTTISTTPATTTTAAAAAVASVNNEKQANGQASPGADSNAASASPSSASADRGGTDGGDASKGGSSGGSNERGSDAANSQGGDKDQQGGGKGDATNKGQDGDKGQGGGAMNGVEGQGNDKGGGGLGGGAEGGGGNGHADGINGNKGFKGKTDFDSLKAQLLSDALESKRKKLKILIMDEDGEIPESLKGAKKPDVHILDPEDLHLPNSASSTSNQVQMLMQHANNANNAALTGGLMGNNQQATNNFMGGGFSGGSSGGYSGNLAGGSPGGLSGSLQGGSVGGISGGLQGGSTGGPSGSLNGGFTNSFTGGATGIGGNNGQFQQQQGIPNNAHHVDLPAQNILQPIPIQVSINENTGETGVGVTSQPNNPCAPLSQNVEHGGQNVYDSSPAQHVYGCQPGVNQADNHKYYASVRHRKRPVIHRYIHHYQNDACCNARTKICCPRDVTQDEDDDVEDDEEDELQTSYRRPRVKHKHHRRPEIHYHIHLPKDFQSNTLTKPNSNTKLTFIDPITKDPSDTDDFQGKQEAITKASLLNPFLKQFLPMLKNPDIKGYRKSIDNSVIEDSSFGAEDIRFPNVEGSIAKILNYKRTKPLHYGNKRKKTSKLIRHKT